MEDYDASVDTGDTTETTDSIDTGDSVEVSGTEGDSSVSVGGDKDGEGYVSVSGDKGGEGYVSVGGDKGGESHVTVGGDKGSESSVSVGGKVGDGFVDIVDAKTKTDDVKTPGYEKDGTDKPEQNENETEEDILDDPKESTDETETHQSPETKESDSEQSPELVAYLQKESPYSQEVNEYISSPAELEVYKQAGLKEQVVDGRVCLIRENLDLSYVDEESGLTNAQLIAKGRCPYDAETGERIELHHMKQNFNAPLAELTSISEHDRHSKELHTSKEDSWRRDLEKVREYDKQRISHWKNRTEEE